MNVLKESENKYNAKQEFDEVVRNLTTIQKAKNFSDSAVAKVFNLQNAAAIANIVQLFITGTAK